MVQEQRALSSSRPSSAAGWPWSIPKGQEANQKLEGTKSASLPVEKPAALGQSWAVTARGAGRELVGGTAEPSRQRSTRAELAELGGRGISRRTGVQTCVQVRTGEYR